MPTLWLLSSLVACGPVGIEVPETARDVAPGTYEGILHFDAKARLGPIRLARDACDADVTVIYDLATDPPIQGTATCALETFGEVEVYFGGDVEDLPFVGGDLDSEEVVGTWEGWFLDSDTLHGEAAGKFPYRPGVNIVYEAFFDVDRTAPPGVRL